MCALPVRGGLRGMTSNQVYELSVGGRHHHVETSVGDWSNRATWWIDGEEIATQKSSVEDSLFLAADTGHDLADGAGALRVRFTTLGQPIRATWFEGSRDAATAASRIGTGGIDLVPDPGSPAAVREEKMRANPRLHAARHVVGGVGTIVVPVVAALIGAWVAARISWPDLGLPAIPWPELPSIPWPEIPWPSIPLPSWDAPDWLRWIVDRIRYVWPVLLGLWLARREMNRRREQDELRARMAAGGPSAPAAEDSSTRDVPPGEAEDAEPEKDETTDARDERPGDVDVLGGDGADEGEGGPLDEPRGQVEAGAHVGQDRGHGEERPDRRLDPR